MLKLGIFTSSYISKFSNIKLLNDFSGNSLLFPIDLLKSTIGRYVYRSYIEPLKDLSLLLFLSMFISFKLFEFFFILVLSEKFGL